MIATDRQSAFDKVMASVPYKGQVLNQTARFWFEQTADLCPNHAVAYPDPNIVVAEKLDMLPVEMVVRDYITGSTETSIWPMYAKGGRELYGDKDDWRGNPTITFFSRDGISALLNTLEVEFFEEEETDGTTPRGKHKHWHIFHIVARKS